MGMMGSRYYNLDGLRGVCALTVVFFHLTYCNHGGLAVDVFFVLSGFVLAHSYERRLLEGLTPSRFIWARAKRLFPIYWMGILSCAAVIIFALNNYRDVQSNFLSALFIIPNWNLDAKAYPIDPITWSLAWEWVVSILFATVLFRIKTAWLVIIAISGWSAMTTVGFFLPQSWDMGVTTRVVAFVGLIRAIPAFCCGIVLFRMKNVIVPHIPEFPPVVLLATWVFFAVIHKSGPSPIYDALLAILLGPALILLLIRCESRASKWCAFAGRLSYPLYACHLAAITVTQTVMAAHHAPITTNLLAVAVALLLAWAIAAANDRIQGWLRRPTLAAHPAE